MQININKKIVYFLEKGLKSGTTLFAIQGGRRAGKTFNILQWLLLRMWNEGEQIITASMTQDQGREGAYADCKEILRLWQPLDNYYEVLKQPREITCVRNNTPNSKNGKMIFRSYQDAETAKGGACDWVFINEGNKFSKQQYLDLSANARKGVIVDFNPNEHFWVDEFLTEDKILKLTWQDNIRHLTDAQLQWFKTLKAKAFAPTATDVDRYYYKVYYCGEYAEIGGEIFTKENIHTTAESPSTFDFIVIFSDPSSLRGADWFANVVAGYKDGKFYILETFSINQGRKEEVARWAKEKLLEYENARFFVETNGLIGTDFYEFCQRSDLPVEAWYSTANKFDRIIAKYEDITSNTFFVETESLEQYLEQIYTFNKRCEHDDNIDAVASAITILKIMQ